jgi:hypothetical protein
MPNLYASEFGETPTILTQSTDLREEIIRLIEAQPIAGKVTDGGDRLLRFKDILKSLVRGEIALAEACRRTELDLPRQNSIHAANNQVFPHDWAERHVRTQFSRFYNQALMERLLLEGETQCFVPHSSAEAGSSKCTMYLAGKVQDLKTLHDRLIESYARGNWSRELKIPEHPHCTHVVTPVR